MTHGAMVLGVSQMRSFVCYICSKSCQGELSYEQHVNLHLGLRTGSPEKCLGGHKCEQTDKRNICSEHNSTAAFTHVCYICGKSFRGQNLLNSHIDSHLKRSDKQQGKSSSETVFKTEDQLNLSKSKANHIKIGGGKCKRTSKPGKPTCGDCGNVFEFYSKLRIHRKELHGIDTQIKCGDCGKVFKYRSQLSTHKAYSHGKFKDAVFKCDQCDKTYKNAACLKRHSFNHLGLSFMCDQCSSSFVSKEKLGIHFNFVHKGAAHKCTECDYKSARANEVRNHMNRRHSDGKDTMYTCPECGNLYRHQYKTCLDHRVARKKNKGSNMIACANKCGFEVKWSNEHGLKKHYSRSRCDPKNALIRKHKCHICERTFSTESRKNKHEKYHFEEKPHKCGECQATFMDSWGLKRHIGDKVCNSHLSLERQRRSTKGIV